MKLLSPVEQAYLNGTREFTKPQIRYIKCRLKKKLRHLDEKGCNAAALLQRLEEEGWRGDSLVRIPPRVGNILEKEKEEEEEGMGRRRFELLTPAMSRRYPNQARPPAQYTMKKFAAQIYVVDRLYMKLANPLP
jgi:hypothetical protein